MEYQKIEGLNKKISKLVFGTATPVLTNATSKDASAQDKQKAFELLDMVFESGINTFDCAAHYGESILGEWMELRKNRDECVVLTKGAHPNDLRDRVTEYDILSDIHDSLKRLRTDYIDIYMLHRDNPDVSVNPIVDVLNKLYNEKKVTIFGGSNWTHQRIEEANNYAKSSGQMPFMASSPNFGLAEQIADPWVCDAKFGGGCVTISGPQNSQAREWYAKNNMTVFAYSSLARGFFSGAFGSNEPKKAKEILDYPGYSGYFCENNLKRLQRCEELSAKKNVTVAQIALSWIFNQKFNVVAISGPINKEQLEANIAAITIKLDDDEVKWLNLE